MLLSSVGVLPCLRVSVFSRCTLMLPLCPRRHCLKRPRPLRGGYSLLGLKSWAPLCGSFMPCLRLYAAFHTILLIHAFAYLVIIQVWSNALTMAIVVIHNCAFCFKRCSLFYMGAMPILLQLIFRVRIMW